jgi:uncharacterized protein YbbC (DUF1343 family)
MEKSRIGLLCNPASVDRHLRHAREAVASCFPGRLQAIFAPQHGFYAEKQDNMIESADTVDPVLGIPVYSLYSRTRVPSAQMFAGIDVLLVDLQDVGTRVYTFVYTLSYCMETAAALGTKVVVLDRPNPVNGRELEGNLLDPEYASFVGRYPIPMRHGLTIGEMALLFNRQFGIGCDLSVVPMQGWRREMFFGDTGLPWVPPSPNLPTPAAALVYPGQVIWEGTNLSEGRGTCQPFEVFGAPFLDPPAVAACLRPSDLAGVVLRETVFEPTSNKWAGQGCRGFQLHVVDPHTFRPYTTALALLQAVVQVHSRHFAWKPPPYEYEYVRRPIDLILGDRKIRKRIEAGEDTAQIVGSWRNDLLRFAELCRDVHLYA